MPRLLERQLERLLEQHGRTYSKQLGICLKSGSPKEFSKWFLASILYAKPISENIATRAYKQFETNNLVTAKEIMAAGWHELVDVLDSGSYVRYDHSTADKLLNVMTALEVSYGGDLNKLYKQAKSQEDLEQKIKVLGKGVGDTTVSIFLRDMQDVWRVKAKPTRLELLAARKLGIRDVHDYWKKHKIRGFTIANFQTALARLGKKLR